MSEDSAIFHIDTMLSQLSSSGSSSNPKIFKVNSPLRQVNEKAYDPVLVAIGPIHHNKDDLKNMESHKKRFLHQLLDRRNERGVERYVVELRNLDKRARQFYENCIQLPDSDKFVQMLLLDGIFVIELLRKYSFEALRREGDNIFQFTQVFNQIRRDLVLIENQLPFFVLHKLFEMTKIEDPNPVPIPNPVLVPVSNPNPVQVPDPDTNPVPVPVSDPNPVQVPVPGTNPVPVPVPVDNLQVLFLNMMEGYVRWMRPEDESRIHEYIIDDHLAGLLYQSNFSNNGECMLNHFDLDEIKTISELNEAGIKFKPTHGDGGSSNWTDASFKDGVLQLPLLRLYDKTESVLRNLIAYEQMLPEEHPRPMTNYSVLMQCMIHSAKDVEILRRAGIIRTWLGDDATAHVMINKLGKNIMMNQQFTYFDVIQNVNGYCRRRRKRWMFTLKRNYCYSPWAILSLFAAAILLALTATQTIFAGISL